MGPWDGVRSGRRAAADEPERAKVTPAASLDSTRQSEKAEVLEKA
jgi:hypothetical protein